MKNLKNVSNYIFGEGSIKSLEEILFAKRNAISFVVFLVDDFWENKNIQDILPIKQNDILIFVSTAKEPKAEYIDVLTDAIKYRCQNNLPAVVVGMGGGTVMDISKCVSILLNNQGKAEDYQGWDLVKNPGVYKIGIPTISGTGAEASRTGIFTSKKAKLGMNSDYSMFDQIILDPNLIKTVPKDQFLYTAMDCYAHDVELLKSNNGQMTKSLAKNSLDLLKESLENPQNIDYGKLMVASYLGGCAMVGASGGHLCHPVSYGLGFVLGLRHGISVCLAFNVLEDYYPEYINDFRQIFAKFSVELPKNITKDVTESQFDQMAEVILKNERPLEVAFGKDWREIFTKEKIKEILKRI